jgi:8-oxo-dGTP pyrophosphatase MutT (NUDIX family)
MDNAENHAGADDRRRGVVAVVIRQGRLLVIRRSQSVVAPGAVCFPGGGIEPGESEFDALVREIGEELGSPAVPIRPLWRSVTPWNVALSWWLAELDEIYSLVPNLDEVESIHWLSPRELLEHPKLLSSNREFLEAVLRGEIDLEAGGEASPKR